MAFLFIFRSMGRASSLPAHGSHSITHADLSRASLCYSLPPPEYIFYISSNHE